jgi:nitrite reductase/ring-hydroxylating ferredoxin subunit
MPSHEWVFAIDENELKEDSMRIVFPKGIPILLLKKAGRIHAVSNKCAHMTCELGSGDLDGYTIKCPCHEWRFDIRTGKFLDAGEIKIPTYESKLLDGKVLVRMGRTQ